MLAPMRQAAAPGASLHLADDLGSPLAVLGPPASPAVAAGVGSLFARLGSSPGDAPSVTRSQAGAGADGCC